MISTWSRKGKREFPSEILTSSVVEIVGDAAISTNAVGDGRFVPVVILDTTQRRDIADLIAIHDKVPPGDALSAWASLQGFKDHLALVLRFLRPAELDLALNFNLAKQGSVVELALRARAIYLQAGKPGDRFYRTSDAPRIIVEIGGQIPAHRWDELWRKAIKRELRAKGFSRSDAKRASASYIDNFRETFDQHRSMPRGIYISPDMTTDDAEAASKESS
jgi:hypothetical protein